jgi:hypothetical protein
LTVPSCRGVGAFRSADQDNAQTAFIFLMDLLGDCACLSREVYSAALKEAIMKRKSWFAALLSCLSLSLWVAGCNGSYRAINDGPAGELCESLSCNFSYMAERGAIMESSSETLVSQIGEGLMGHSTQGFWIVDTERTREFLLQVMGRDPSEFEWAPTLPAEPDLSFTLADMAWFLSKSAVGKCRPPTVARSLGIGDLDDNANGWCRDVCLPKLSGDDADFAPSWQFDPLSGVNVSGSFRYFGAAGKKPPAGNSSRSL